MLCEFPKILSNLRRSHGLSQKKAAEELGISPALLSHYENGIRDAFEGLPEDDEALDRFVSKVKKLIASAFAMRRKTLTNSLSSICEKDELIKILNQLNIDENVRGEKLSLQQFADIANLMS